MHINRFVLYRPFDIGFVLALGLLSLLWNTFCRRCGIWDRILQTPNTYHVEDECF